MREFLTALIVSSIVIANITAAKLAWFTLPIIGPVAVPAGFVAFGVAFLCSDLLVEFEGEDYARRVVNGTVAALVVSYVLIYIAIMMPVAPFYGAHDAYIQTLGASTNIVIASIVTILMSQHIDVSVFSKLKQRTDGQKRYLRNLGSTTLSQLIDTVVFITLAFAVIPVLQGQASLAFEALVATIIGQYIVKLLVAVLDTPVFYLVTEVRK